LTASTNEMAGAAQTEALTEAQALFLKEHDLSLKDFGSLINALRAIRGLGQLIENQADFESAVNKLNGRNFICWRALWGLLMEVFGEATHI
ncbi:hypothetical protein, partial [Pseudidiomarina sp.]|uniref:hypothetical protein n=1 Tax=Pseudidiomarina sp. TaxID=2081707 RepID=UPI00299EF87A